MSVFADVASGISSAFDPSSGSNLDPSTLAIGDHVNNGLLIWVDASGATQTLAFDVTTMETHGGEMEVTDHPVQEGVPVTDNVQKKTSKISVTAFISNQPISARNDSIATSGSFITQALTVPSYTPPLQPTPGSLNNAAGSAVSGFVGALLGGDKNNNLQVFTFDDEGFDAVEATLDLLEGIQDGACVCEVHTTKKIYSNMMLESWQLVRTPDSGEGGEFQLDFRAVRVVQAKLTTAPYTADKPRAATKISKGAQPTTPAPKTSVLQKLTGGFGQTAAAGLPPFSGGFGLGAILNPFGG